MALPVLARVVVRGGLTFLGAGAGPATVGAVSIQSNVRAETRKIERLVRTHNVITARALSLAARRAATDTRRELASVKNLPQRVLRKRVQAHRAYPNRKPIRSAVWLGLKNPVKAGELGSVNPTSSGHVRIGKRIFRGAFRATMPSGHRGVFTRKVNARHRPRPDGQWTQLPIEEGVARLDPEAEPISRRASERHLRETYPKEARRLMELKARGGF